MRSLVERLKSGGLVALLGDRDISGRGIAVDFFGEKAGFPAGPATLALLTGAPLYPVTMHFEGPMSVGVVHDRVEIPESLPKDERVAHMTQQIARAFEIGIAKHPEDWHMLQKVWLADRKPR
jgi:KDO2-lipid IV(A) lauroyltransferase